MHLSVHRYALSYPLLGMIFDIFDGKVARWRNESSMLGQELDSLADSVSRYKHSRASSPGTDLGLLFELTDLVWSCTSSRRLDSRTSYDPRHPRSHLLHLLRNRSSRSFQRNRRTRTERRYRKIEILRRSPYSLLALHLRRYGNFSQEWILRHCGR